MAPATPLASALSMAVEVERDGGRCVTVQLPHEEEQPVPAPTARGEGELHLVNYVNPTEHMNSRKGSVDDELFKNRCSVSAVMMGGAAKGPCARRPSWTVVRVHP